MGALTVLFQAYISFYKTGEWRYSLLIQQVLSLWSMFVNCCQFLSSLYIPWESCVWRLAGLLTDICLYLWIRSPGVFLDTYCQRFDLTSSFSYSCSQEITPCPTLPVYPTLPASNNSHDHSLTYKDHCTKHWQIKMSCLDGKGTAETAHVPRKGCTVSVMVMQCSSRYYVQLAQPQAGWALVDAGMCLLSPCNWHCFVSHFCFTDLRKFHSWGGERQQMNPVLEEQ